ncbi:MAG: M48 family metallopeptidase [Armatimonadetes bacterium]|nr:M48 family metallopeptidase [Armatimonadota bacterium]MDW8027373.1 M48 family metallopeptidase [Armatimonadota bacterium]
MLRQSFFVPLFMLFLLVPVSAQIILISRNQEIEIGKEVAAALERQYGVWDNPEQTRRIERIGRSLVAVCERKDMPYTFKILNERKELNAMAAPGGFIYITRALLEALESDDEVAFVLGHEIGHIAGDHIRKQISQGMVGSILLDILTGGASQIVRIGSDIMFALYQSGYSRQHERDADTRGVRYMKAAGYNPIAAITALKKLGSERYKGLVRWFGTHPDIPSRIERIARMLGVDPETLKPLPQGASSEKIPERSEQLFYLSENSLFLLPTKGSNPQKIWHLKNHRLQAFEVSPDGKTFWLLVRREGSNLVHLAVFKNGSRKTDFMAHFFADEIYDFRLSPNSKWLATLAKENGKTFIKLFESTGKEVQIQDRTPIGEISAILWTKDNKLLVFTERFGEVVVAILALGETVRFVPTNSRTAPTLVGFEDERNLIVLTDETLQHVPFDDEQLKLQPLASPVSNFAVGKGQIVLVKDGKLQRGILVGKDLQTNVIDDQEGEFSDLTISSDGQWLAYTYRSKPSEQPQIWLAHLTSNRLWRVAMNASKPKFSGH